MEVGLDRTMNITCLDKHIDIDMANMAVESDASESVESDGSESSIPPPPPPPLMWGRPVSRAELRDIDPSIVRGQQI